MNQVRFYQSLTSGYPLLVIVLLYFLGIRVLNLDTLSSPELWITVGIQLLTGVLLLWLSRNFVFVRVRTFLPIIFFLLFTGTDPTGFCDWKESLYVLGVLLCFVFLFRSYEDEHSRAQALNMGIILTAGSVFHPVFYALILLFIFGLYRLGSLSIRVFLSAICGSLLVYILLFCWCLYQNDPALFLSYFPGWNAFYPEFMDLTIRNILFYSFLLILFISAGVNLFLSGNPGNMKAFSIMSFIFGFALLIFVLIFIESQWQKEWTAILAIPLSLLYSHFFLQSKSKAKTFFLILSVLFFIFLPWLP